MKTNSYTTIIKILILGTMVLTLVPGQATQRRSAEENDKDPRILNVDEYGDPWITGDTNENGRVNYALRRDDRGRKEREAVDHNHDGYMDNFYYYRNGVLHRQEIDTNYDGKIDLWIYMYDGVRVERYERDTNHDGEIDVVRVFGGS